jgi:hypothetical protein
MKPAGSKPGELAGGGGGGDVAGGGGAGGAGGAGAGSVTVTRCKEKAYAVLLPLPCVNWQDGNRRVHPARRLPNLLTHCTQVEGSKGSDRKRFPTILPERHSVMTDSYRPDSDTENVPVLPVPQISSAQLKDIESIDDAMELLRETYGEQAVETAAGALGDGFALTKNKDQFIGKPAIFVHWSISDGDFPVRDADGNPTGEVGKFVAARIVTKGGKFVIVDGGTGIAKQLIDYTETTGKTYLVAQKGLRVSRGYSNAYTDNGETFYIDTTVPD